MATVFYRFSDHQEKPLCRPPFGPWLGHGTRLDPWDVIHRDRSRRLERAPALGVLSLLLLGPFCPREDKHMATGPVIGHGPRPVSEAFLHRQHQPSQPGSQPRQPTEA